MQPDRRTMLKMMAATGAAAITESAVAAQVKWSGGAERPKLKAPADACDCHHHIYDVAYPTDRRGIAFPGDASIADYRALQRPSALHGMSSCSPRPTVSTTGSRWLP
jgi:hypothetical protein